MFLDLCGYSLRSTACTRYPFSDLPLNAASGGRLPSLTRPPLAARPATPSSQPTMGAPLALMAPTATLRTLCLQGTACSHRTRTCTPTAVAVTHSPPLSFPQRDR